MTMHEHYARKKNVRLWTERIFENRARKVSAPNALRERQLDYGKRQLDQDWVLRERKTAAEIRSSIRQLERELRDMGE